jgi:hypothetical protein
MISKLLLLVLALFASVGNSHSVSSQVPQIIVGSTNPSNGCVTFSVSQGTGCDWMCNYCSNQLGTNNYYFTDNVCTYESGVGCVGNPLAGKQYTCCAAGDEKDEL